MDVEVLYRVFCQLDNFFVPVNYTVNIFICTLVNVINYASNFSILKYSFNQGWDIFEKRIIVWVIYNSHIEQNIYYAINLNQRQVHHGLQLTIKTKQMYLIILLQYNMLKYIN